MVAMFLAALDQTIVATAMPTIGRALGDFENLPWIVTTYLLTSTAVTPLYGKISDITGRRVMLLVSGEAKREPLAQFLHGGISTDFPASFLWMHIDLTILCDRKAYC